MEYQPQFSKELAIVVEFFKLFLKQEQIGDSKIVEGYLVNFFDRLVLQNAPPGAQHREILNYRRKLLDFILQKDWIIFAAKNISNVWTNRCWTP